MPIFPSPCFYPPHNHFTSMASSSQSISTSLAINQFHLLCWRIDSAMQVFSPVHNSLTTTWWQLSIFYNLVRVHNHIENSHFSLKTWTVDCNFTPSRAFSPWRIWESKCPFPWDPGKCSERDHIFIRILYQSHVGGDSKCFTLGDGRNSGERILVDLAWEVWYKCFRIVEKSTSYVSESRISGGSFSLVKNAYMLTKELLSSSGPMLGIRGISWSNPYHPI